MGKGSYATAHVWKDLSGQLCGVTSLFPSLRVFQGLTSDQQASMVSTFSWLSHLALQLLSKQILALENTLHDVKSVLHALEDSEFN